MHKYISADWIFPVSSGPIQNGVIGVGIDGEINQLLTAEEAAKQSIVIDEVHSGVLVPGFINTHCHLELSHMRGKIAERTGLPNFIKAVLAHREQDQEEMVNAMRLADREMFEQGIVAVGDISNLLLSKSIKLNSKVYYHTFVEVFGFNRPSEPIIESGLRLKDAFEPLRASIVPHAPYSVSSTLFDEINKVTTPEDILSIHNQETEGENDLFETGTGKFADFFAELGIAQSDAHHSARRSIDYHLPQLPKKNHVLLVHNTMSQAKDIDFAERLHQHLYWCLCANANLYIEDAMPPVQLLKEAGVNITLGTDSLASNHQLSILAEMKTLQDQADLYFEELLRWGTLNGAKFLNIADVYGSFEIGKKPGVLLLDLDSDLKIKNDTKIKRLF